MDNDDFDSLTIKSINAKTDSNSIFNSYKIYDTRSLPAGAELSIGKIEINRNLLDNQGAEIDLDNSIDGSQPYIQTILAEAVGYINDQNLFVKA